MYFITKTPVVILSSKRTGSTALAIDMRDQLMVTHDDLRFYSEPMEAKHTALMDDLMSSIQRHEPFILKVHACDMIREYPLIVNDMVRSGECFLVRIRRRNVIEQIASHYLASKSNVWHHHQGGSTEVPDLADVDMKWLDR